MGTLCIDIEIVTLLYIHTCQNEIACFLHHDGVPDVHDIAGSSGLLIFLCPCTNLSALP